MKKLIATTLIALAMAGCSKSYCPQTVEFATNSALVLCLIAADKMDHEDLAGKTAKEWCEDAGNFAPYFTQYVSEMCELNEEK